MCKRLGFYTGNIYDQKTDVNNIHECSMVIEDNISESELCLKRIELKQRCHGCTHCSVQREV
jgi:hypothetical protein